LNSSETKEKLATHFTALDNGVVLGKNNLTKLKGKIYLNTNPFRYKPPPLIRLFALEINSSCYLITGGSIKLSAYLDRPHLQEQLIKLEEVRNKLVFGGFNKTIFDLNDITI
jgi:hypothetical protein